MTNFNYALVYKLKIVIASFDTNYNDTIDTGHYIFLVIKLYKQSNQVVQNNLTPIPKYY